MNRIARKALPHVAWIAACVVVAVIVGAAPSSKDSQPLTRNSFVTVAEQVLPAVVSISLTQEFEAGKLPEGHPGIPIPNLPERFREFFQFQPERMPDWMTEEDEDGKIQRPLTGGSGVIIRKNGYIVTNLHVIGYAVDREQVDIVVTLHDGRSFSRKKEELEIVAYDSLRDLAVLKVKASGLPFLEWGNSADLRVGEWVLAVGNPLDLEGSASQGIVSQKHRKVQKNAIEDLLQTTAMINPGSSGGALVNLDGELIGINVVIATNTGRWQGVGFAIPSRQAKWVTDSIVEHGKVIQGYMGVTMSEETVGRMSKQTAKYYDLPKPAGVLVEAVTEGGAASEAKMKKGDVIVEIRSGQDSYSISRNGDLLSTVASLPVGKKIEVDYYRDGKKETARVTLRERPPAEELAKMIREPEERKGRIGKLGFSGKETLDPQAGVEITKIDEDGPAAKAEPIALKVGDVITEVNDRSVAAPSEALEALTAGKSNMHKVKFVREGRGEAVTYISVE